MRTTQSANDIVEAIATHPSIVDVSLNNLLDEDINGYDTLCSLFTRCKSLASIEFSSNSVCTLGDTRLSDFLATNPPLSYLELNDSDIDNNDMKCNASALKYNTKLSQLHLWGNSTTEEGDGIWKKTICDWTSLNSVADSNHICWIQGVDEGNTCNWLCDPEMNKRIKIYSLLSMRNKEGTNIHYLEMELKGSPLSLVPHILERICFCYKDVVDWNECDQGDENPVPPLSLLHEVLHGWATDDGLAVWLRTLYR